MSLGLTQTKGDNMEFLVKAIHKLFGLVLVIALVGVVTNYKFDSMKDVIPTQSKSYVTATSVDRTLDCLAMNIYREAGHESFEGKVAVAQVTLNRVDSPHFPKDVCSVIYQKNVVMEKVVCQFSWYCNGVLQKAKPNDEAYKESYIVAKKVLLEGFRLDGLKDALFYHAVYVRPNWPYQKIATIGNHIFYRNKA
jgi:spore germination cell wall hydrolase CwlJ-like protein